MRNVSQTILAIGSCLFACLTAAKAQFIISGYQQTSTPGQYDILGTGLLSVTSLAYTPYDVAGTTPYPLSFTAVSNEELTINLGQNITNVVDLVFSNSTYIDVEIPFVVGQIFGRNVVPLTTVTSGETLSNGSGSQVVLVLPGGSYGTGGGGSNTIFIENGGSFLGFEGGGSNALYYVPGASISNPYEGGGNAPPIEVNSINPEVNSINQLLVLAVPEPSTWALLLGGLSLLAFWRIRTRRTAS